MPGRRGRCAVHCCGSTWALTPPPSTTGRRSFSSATWHARTATAGCAASASRAWPSPSIPLVTRHRAQRPFDDAPSDQNLGSAYQDGYYGYLSKVLRQALGRRVRGRYRMLRCADGRHAACAAAVRGSLAAAVGALTGTTSTSRSVARWWLVPCHGRTAPRSSKWCRSDHEAIGGRMTVGGSCLCGDVAFELVPGDWMGHCHCSMCRKAHGAAFATHVSTEA